MKYVISCSKIPQLKVKGEEAVFPVTRIFGIGRNYSKDINSEKKDDKKVVLFMKDAYLLSPAEEGVTYPKDSNQLRYEIELVVAIGKEGRHISPQEADKYIYGYATGIDFTKYDVQEIAKQQGWPWDKGKSFLGCAPCSKIIPKKDFLLNNNRIWLKKNNFLVQDGNLGQMLWSVPEIIALVSSSFGILPGDLIFTGTPDGVGMVEKGDILEGGVEGLDTINFNIQ